MYEAFTTGQVAKMLNVHTRTICKWFDQGKLSGFRVPGTHDRRIPREALLHFLNKYGLAVPPELTGPATEEEATQF